MTFNLLNVRDKSSNVFDRRNGLDRIFEDFYNDFNRPFLSEKWRGSAIPKLDISETDNTYHIEAELPGIKLQDIELKLDNNILTIKGQTEENSEENEKNYYMRERYHGNFQRSITLPNIVNEDDIKASLKDGILVIDIPKKEQSSIRRIQIKEQ